MKYTGEIEGQYRSREDPKKLALIREIPGNTGELVTLPVSTAEVRNGGTIFTTHMSSWHSA
jgi:hypothetical protein